LLDAIRSADAGRIEILLRKLPPGVTRFNSLENLPVLPESRTRSG
jgi:hypothetical protein